MHLRESEMEQTGAKCPGCAKRPMVHDMMVNKFSSGVLAAVNYCHDCGHIIGVFMRGMEQPQTDTPQAGDGPRLVS
jgi:uncharacterized Zn finger protein